MNFDRSPIAKPESTASEKTNDPIDRLPNTTVGGEPFDEKTVNAVWEKAQKEFGFFFYRKDVRSTIIAKYEYGKKSKYGWEVDHIIPVIKGGTDDLSNLQPLHWKNNQSKGNDYSQKRKRKS